MEQGQRGTGKPYARILPKLVTTCRANRPVLQAVLLRHDAHAALMLRSKWEICLIIGVLLEEIDGPGG